MQYNKKQFNKVNDKKVMKKVKKQWVVVSVATLAFLGAAAYGTASTNTVASADTVNNSQQSSPQSNNTQSQNNSNSSSQSSFNNDDESAKYASQIQQGYQDAYKNNGNNSSTLSGQAANYYNAAYNGAQSAINAYNNNTQGQGAGTQDYNYYGNTVTKQDGFQSDNQNAQTGSNGFNSKRKTAGNNSADTTGSSNQTTTTATTTQSNPTDGTPLNNTNPNNINQGGADNPKDASNSVAKYESTMLNKLNSSNNTSVKATSPSQAINIPTANTDAILNDRKQYSDFTGLAKAFDQGVTYALTQQGMSDAETGKWQGVYVGSNGGATQDYYLNSAKNDTTNVYDQAYRGARDAMNKFFTNNSYNGNTAVSQSATNNTAYDTGFNDVVNQASQGIVYVQNSNQYSSIMTSYTNPNTVGGNTASGINVVRIANDMDMTGATNGENDGTVYTNFATFTIDGQHHMVDFHGNNYTINRNGNGSLDVYLQNFQTMYGANYFGAFRAENGAVFHFNNINYVGPQLLSSYNNDTYFSGNVNVLVPTASPYYTSPFQSNVNIEGNGNQENLEVNNFILEPNSNYFGNTSPNYGGTNVVVTGNFTLGENSKMTLIPRGGNSGAATIADGSTWGIWLRNSGASLNINKNATLNIIPLLYNNQKYLFGGAVYSGTQVTININGGTLNYEGYNGISGYYNQPIDIQGSNQTQINVINGGVMQVLMDSIPDTTLWNSYSGHQSTYDGLINNVGLGNFNVGSRGNLKVGVTNSDSTYNVPYYGPININSVGSNHAIFIKPNIVQQFQTTTGTSGTGKAGNINAFSVAITQADGTKQYLYNFTLNSGSTTYTGVDFNGNQVSGNISGNKLEIADVPAVQFVGPLNKQVNGDGSTTVTAYAKLSNYKELNNQPIYVGVASSNSNGSYNQLTQMPNSNVPDSYSKADPNTYTTTIDTTGYTGGIIPITYNIPSGTPTAYIGMRLHYGINSVNSILTPQGYNSTVEGYQAGSNGKVVETSTGDMQIANGQTSNIQSGISDALADSIGNTTSNKDAEPFNTKTNADYLASYSSIQSGYSAFDPSNPNQDITQLAAYINSSNPSAFAQGYKEAAYQAGLRDARFNQTNVTGNANYSEAQTQYNQAYQAALSNPGVSVQQLIQQNNLPTLTSNGTAATAVTTAISDAQGALAFIADEQAATIKGSNYNALNGDKNKIAAYNDAYAGYSNALSVSITSDNPDSNADKAESAGFDYTQSLINGGLSATTPTTGPHKVNLQAAISGYNAAQAAVNAAKTNGANSQDAKATSHDNVSVDKYNGDLTAYKSIKFGAYAGLANKTDQGLNTLEKVGYAAVIAPVAYQEGVDAFNSNSGNTPTGIAASSQTGQTAFSNGYNDALNAFNSGSVDGANAVKSNESASTTVKAENIPAKYKVNGLDTSYSNGYAAGVTAFTNGINAYNNNGSSTATSGTDVANDTTKQSYSDGYKYAQNSYNQGITDGSNVVSTTTSTTPSSIPAQNDSTAYNKGYSVVITAYQDGTKAFSSTSPNATAPSPTGADNTNATVGNAYTKGYSDAQSAFNNGTQDGMNAATPNASATPTNVPTNNANAYKSGYAASINAYQDGANAYKNNGSQTPVNASDTLNDNVKQSYINGYNHAKTSYASGAAAGLSAVKTNTTASSTTTAPEGTTDSSEYESGYADAVNAYKSGANTFSSKNPTASIPASPNSETSVAQAFTKGYSDAQNSYNQGTMNGASDVKNNPNVSSTTTVPNSIPADNANQDAYKQGYQAAVEAYNSGANSFNNNGSNTINDGNVNSAVKNSYEEGYKAAEASYIQGKSTGLNVVQTNPSAANSSSSLPASVASNGSQYATNSTAYSTGYKGAVDGYKDGNTSTGQKTSQDSGAGSNYSNAYNSGYDDGRATAGANDYLTKHSSAAHDEPYISGYTNAEQGHTSGYSAASSAAATSTAVPSATTVNPSANYQYTVGFNGGVSDAGKDAGAKSGATAFLNNQTADSLSDNSAKSGFADAASGFNDALTGKSQASGANSNYASGYAAYASASSAWANDETNASSSAQATGSANSTTVTNDVFNSINSSLNGQSYASSQSTTGNMYSQVASKFASQASSAYQSAMSNALSSNASSASSNDYFVNKAINDVNDGFSGNSSNGNEKSVGYDAGRKLKNQENAGITAANTNYSAGEPADSNAKDAYDATKQAYQDVVNGSGSQSVTNKSRVYQDAYAQAVSNAQSQLEDNRQKAINAIKSGQSSPFTDNSASAAAWNQAFNDMQSGYSDAKTGKDNLKPSNANYSAGFNTGNAYNASVKAAESVTKLTATRLTQPTDAIRDIDAYNGVIDALNTVYSYGTSDTEKPQHLAGPTDHYSADYANAYNAAIDSAYEASQKAQRDMKSGTLADDSSVATAANKAIYQNAYQQTADGFNAGLNNGSLPANQDGASGYNYATGVTTGKSYAQGYQDAVNDFLKNTNSNLNEPGYQETMNALLAANSGNQNPQNTALSNYAYSQQLATKNALSDIANGTTSGQTAPAGVDANIYAKAYTAVHDGYQDATKQTTPVSSDNKKNDSTLPYTASYQQGLAAGRVMQGANDYVHGSVNNDVANQDTNYQKGVQEAQAGYTDGKNGNDDQAKNNGFNTTDKAYQLGFATGQSSQNGVSKAQSTNSTPDGLIGDALNAYYAVKDAYNQVMNPGTAKPSQNNGGVDSNSQAYQDAYAKALRDAQNAEQDGQSKFASQSGEPSLDGTMLAAAKKDGYDKAKSGYKDEQDALKKNSSADVSSSSKNDSYNAGVAMAKNVQAGINAYVNSSQPSGDVQQAAFDAAQQAYADAKTNNSTAHPTSSVDNANKQLYTDAYQQAKANADSQVQAGINDYLAGNPNSGKSDQNSVLHDSSMSDAQTGFNDVMNNNATTPAQANNPAYMGGYNAAKSVQQAITDLSNGQKNQNEANAANKSAYDSAVSGGQQALDDAKNGQFTNTPSGNPEYNSAYKAMQQFAVNAHQQGITDASNDPFQSADPNANNLKNADAQAIANNAYKQVQDGFNAVFNNQTISNPTDANQAGSSLANSAKQYVDALASGTTPSANIPQAVIDKINALQAKVNNAFNANPQASDVDSDDSDPFSKYVYKKLMDQNQANYNAGIAQAKQLGNSNSTNPAYNKGYSDFTNGLISAIKNNGSTNGVATAVKDEVTSAYSAYQKGTKDTSEPSGSNVNPIEKAAYDAYQQGKSSAQTHETFEQVQADLNNLSSVAQQAYNQGYNDQQAADRLSSERQSGLADFKNGQTSPSDPSQASVDSFNAAQAGYADGQNGSKDATKYANDSSYKYGYDLGQALQAAKQNVQAGNLNTTDKQTMDAQTAIANGIKDAENNSNNNAQNASLSSQRLYSDAYNAGKTLGTNALATGANEYVAGNSRPTGGQDGSIAHAKVVGYQDANSGFAAGYVLGATNTNQSDPSYTTGFNAAQTAAIVIDNIQNGHNTTTTDSANTTQATNGYAAAASAFEANPDHPSASTNTNPAYNLAYNSAINHLTNQYQAGINDFTSGKNAADVSAANSQYDKDAINNGYNDAQTGFQAAMSNSSSYNNSTADEASKAGYALGQLVQKGINAIKNSTDKNASAGTKNNDVDTAIQTARDNVLANPAILANSVPSSITSSVARQAYIAAVNAFEQEYQAGVNKVVNGTASEAKNDANNDVFAQQGVSDAIQAIKDGFNGATNSKPNLGTAYQMGADAKTGVTEANSGQPLNTSESNATQVGNNAANAAIKHASSSDSDKVVDISNESEIYQLAYQAGINKSSDLIKSGSNAFINGLNRPIGNDDPSAASQVGYDQALAGYQDAKNGRVDKNNKSTSYLAGVQAYDQAKTGFEYAQAHYNDSSKGIPTDSSASKAQKLAAQAVMDAFNGKGETNPDNAIYDDAYKQEVINKQNYASEGAANGAVSNSSNVDNYPDDVKTEIDKAAYAQGYLDGYNGYQAGMNDVSAKVDTLNTGINQQDAQNGAIKAIQDILNDKDPYKLEPPLNASPVAQKAYKQAIADAKQFIAEGRKDADEGIVPSSAGTDAKSKVINYVYEHITNGYTSQRDNYFANAQNNTTDSNSYFGDGVTIANDLKNKVDAFTNNATPNDGSVAAQAYNDGINNLNSNQPKTNTPGYMENNDLYTLIKNEAMQNASIGSDAFVSGQSKNPNSTTLAQQAQQAGYDQASAGFNAGLLQSAGSTSDAHQTPSYIKGQNAALAVKDAEDNIENGGNNVAFDSDSYQKATAGYQAAYQAVKQSNDPLSLNDILDASDANASNPAYSKAYKDAIDHLKSQYTQGVQQFNDGKNTAQTAGVKSSYDIDILQKAFRDAQTAYHDGLNGTNSLSNNSALNDTNQAAKNVANAIAQATKDADYDDVNGVIAAAKQAFISNPMVDASQYNAAPKYQEVYKASIAQFRAEYEKGINTVTVGNGQGMIGTTNDSIAGLGATDATKAIEDGFKGNDNSFASRNDVAINAAYVMGLDAKQGMLDGQNGHNNSLTNPSAAKRTGNQAALDAVTDLIHHDTSHYSDNALPTYKLSYAASQSQAGTSATDGAKELFSDNDNNAATKADSLMKNNASTAADQSFNQGLSDAKQALIDAQSNNSSLDNKYGKNTDAGKIYFATKAAYSKMDPSNPNGDKYDRLIDTNDALTKLAYDNALAYANKAAMTGNSDGAKSNYNPGQFTNNYAQTVYENAYNTSNSAYSDAINGVNADKYRGNDSADATYAAVTAAISDYVAGNQDHVNAPSQFSDNARDSYNKAYQTVLNNELQKAVEAGIKGYELSTPSADIAKYGNDKHQSALGVVATKAAQNAKQGHDDKLAKVNDSSDYAYQAGQQLVDNEQKGATEALTNVNNIPYADGTQLDNHQQAELDGFNGTVDGYNLASTDGRYTADNVEDYINQHLADKSVAYKDTFKNAYVDGLSKAQAGANAALNDQPDSNINAKGAAGIAEHNGYLDAHNAFIGGLHGTTTDQHPDSPASVAGAQKATEFLKAVKDAIAGKADGSNTDDNYQAGFNTAQLAIKNAIADAKANKKLPANDNDIIVPNGCDPTLYRDVYKATFKGYTNGYNSKGKTADQDYPDYVGAFNFGYKTGTNNIPVSDNTTAPNDFLNNKKSLPSWNNSLYVQQYQQTSDGFEDGFNGKERQLFVTPYSKGYQAGKDAYDGMILAKQSGHSNDQLEGKDQSFVNGYNGYLRGVAAAKRSLKDNKKLSKKDLVGKDKVFIYTYQQGVKAESKIQERDGRKAGIKNATKRHSIPTNIYAHNSAAYVNSYIKAYKNEMKRRMPKYIYNVKTIYTHRRTKFSKQSRIKKYAYTKRYNSTVFKVTGIAYYKNGIPRYRLSNGAIVTAGDHVQNAYYQHNFKQYRVIKPTGVLIHTAKKYSKHNVIRRLTRGTIFNVKKVVKYHGLTRLYVGKNEYITSNKTFVQKNDQNLKK